MLKTTAMRPLREYGAKFDKTEVTALKVSEEEIAAAGARLSDELKQAMAVAVRNIETFHNAQRLQAVDVETLPGVRCQQVTRLSPPSAYIFPAARRRCSQRS
ncbi:histidinol dehydrogenase [Klebsiella oxytoca]|nr:histidinol dehydrogenase [Klebsiella oxytoca]